MQVSSIRGGVKPLPGGQRRAVALRGPRRAAFVPKAVAEPQVANASSNGAAAEPSLAGWGPESWRQREALQVRGSRGAPRRPAPARGGAALAQLGRGGGRGAAS